MHPLLQTARPRQWLKNALVLAAPGAAGVLDETDQLGRVLIAAAAFCLAAAEPTSGTTSSMWSPIVATR